MRTAIITSVFSLTRSGFSKKNGIKEKDLANDDDRSTYEMVVTTELTGIETPATGSESVPVQKKSDAIDMEFQKAIEELASLSHY